MANDTLEHIEEQLRALPAEKLPLVSAFLDRLIKGGSDDELQRDLLLAAETSLRKVWDTPEEDAAWAYLDNQKS